jgi:hypothetical protein
MDESAAIRLEIVYALPDRQTVLTIAIPQGETVAQAIERSGITVRHPEIISAGAAVGIYGRRVSLSDIPSDGDRIEIYRSLTADPKQLRRRRIR